MRSKGMLRRRIDSYLRKRQLLKGKEYMRFEKLFLAKARKNYSVASMLFKISEHDESKKVLSLPQSFETYEWVIIVSYYGMYMSALAALARLGFKSKSHTATIAVLENYYVRKEKLEKRHVDNLSQAYALSEKLITKLIKTKARRETAQYDATPSISRENAVATLEDSEEFITKVEEILQEVQK